MNLMNEENPYQGRRLGEVWVEDMPSGPTNRRINPQTGELETQVQGIIGPYWSSRVFDRGYGEIIDFD